MRLLLAFIAVPLIEIGLFIQVGDAHWPVAHLNNCTFVTGHCIGTCAGAQSRNRASCIKMRYKDSFLGHAKTQPNRWHMGQ